jgi:hypothetical protein
MIRLIILGLVAALAIFNGIFSPKAFMVFALQGIWYPSALPAPLTLMFILSSLITALLHGMLTGVPVAIAQQFAPSKMNAIRSSMLWLVMMLLPTAYTLSRMLWD